jgi:hypothetical protein
MDINKEKLASGENDDRSKRWKRQRIKYGYSDRDVWSFDSFLAEVIAGGVRQISRFGGYPVAFEAKEWQDTLNFIADQFEWYANEQFNYDNDFEEKVTDPEGDFHKAWVLLEANFGGLWT